VKRPPGAQVAVVGRIFVVFDDAGRAVAYGFIHGDLYDDRVEDPVSAWTMNGTPIELNPELLEAAA
jgi:hypothetical protein